MLLALLSAVTLLALTYCAFLYRLNHSKRHGIPQLRLAIPFGNFGPVFRHKRYFGDVLADLYRRSKPLTLVGIYLAYRPLLVAVDPALIKAILVQDSKFFDDSNIFAFKLDRDLRTRLHPTFSASRMREWFLMLSNTAFTLVKALDQSAGQVIEIRDVLSRYAADETASELFGLEVDSINDDYELFREVARRAVASDLSYLRQIGLNFMTPKLKDWLGIKFMDPLVESFMLNTVRKIREHRETNGECHQDFMQVLLDLLSSDPGFNDKAIAEHALFFLMVSYETITTTTSFCLYELARNVDVQRKAQQEIDSVISKDDEELAVENMANMRYMNCCINETNRKYPSVPMLIRTCTKDYLIAESNVTIPTGSTVVIPLLGLSGDPEFYQDPDTFYPERFESKTAFEPCFYPFGAGPRSCIAKSLGYLQNKVALVMLLAKFDIALANPDEGVQRFNPKFFIAKADGGLKLVFTKRD